MKTPKVILLLNEYLVTRELESQAKKAKESLKEAILKLLPPSRTQEWLLASWGKVTYKQPRPSLVVDMDRLALEYPTAYAACVSEEPNSPRFCVYPEKATEAAVFAMRKEAPDGRVQATVHPQP